MTSTDTPQTEVKEDTQETLSVLDLVRTPRPEKLRLEQAYFDGAHEVRFSERTFRPKHSASLDEVRAFVDSLEVRRREPVPVIAPSAQDVPVRVVAGVPPHYRAPLERAIIGEIVSVETIHRVGTGTVVEVEWKTPDAADQRGLFIIRDDIARPYTDVRTGVDALPEPAVDSRAVPLAPVAEEAAPPAEPTPEARPAEEKPESKRRRFFGKRGTKTADEPAEAPPEPAPEAPPEEDSKKRRFGFGRKR